MKVAGYETKINLIKNWLKAGSINVFGMPFAGKDTHCRELAELLGGTVIGGGDILRSKDAPTHIQEHIAKGFLAPMEEFLSISLPYFSRQEFVGKPLVLNAVGRWHGEEAGVLEASAESGHPLLAVIYLKITPEEARQRWENAPHIGDRGSRDDDAEHILATRLEEFRSKTIPVIEFYRDQGMLIEVDGMQPKQQVFKTILDKLALQAAASPS